MRDQSAQGLRGEEATISIYTRIDGDDGRNHKKLHVFDANELEELTHLSPLVETLKDKKTYTRYYFEVEADRDAARTARRKP